MKISLGADHPETLRGMDTLAAVYQAANHWEKALPLLEQSLELKTVRLGLDHPATLTNISGLAFIYYQQEHHSRALEVLQPALETERLRSASQPADRNLRATLLILRAAILNQLARWEEAEHDAREALEIRRDLVPDDWGTFNALSHLGESLLGQAKLDEAAPLLLDGYRGLQERASQMPAMHQRQLLTDACERLVKLYEAQGDVEEAGRWRATRDVHASPTSDLK
jgi:eukaryotic-like serine/threonine-protein kinase